MTFDLHRFLDRYYVQEEEIYLGWRTIHSPLEAKEGKHYLIKRSEGKIERVAEEEPSCPSVVVVVMTNVVTLFVVKKLSMEEEVVVEDQMKMTEVLMVDLLMVICTEMEIYGGVGGDCFLPLNTIDGMD